MKHRNFITAAIMGILMVSMANAKTKDKSVKEFDLDKVVFIEEDQSWDLGFDTAVYLPENFDPYSGKFSISAINYIDVCDEMEIELDFETSEYLPEGFNPYER